MPMSFEYRGMLINLPDFDRERKEYFEHAAQKKLVVQKCKGCALLRWDPGPACPWCQSLEWTWQQVSGKGTIYSYEIVTHAIQPGFRDWVPYPVALVELDEQRGKPSPDEGVRLITNVVDENFNPEKEENVGIGKRVEVVFLPVAEGVFLPQFKLSKEQPTERVWQFQNV
ncbi:MAG: OB-fold domain-containing protein [Chloroflexi bacterium]|nr:OB-fold domain-containing protein [Chloroflexota bacterium]